MRIFFTILLNIFLTTSFFAQKTKKIYYNDNVNSISLADKQKPLIFLDFWATWCAPCISSMPHTSHLDSLYNKDVTFVYISYEPSKKVSSLLDRKGFDFISLIDNKRKSEDEFGVVSIPRSFLLDPEGSVLWTGSPTDMSKSLLESYIYSYTKKGKEDRFVKYTLEDVSEKWNNYSYKVNLKYIESDAVVDEILDNSVGNFYISGGFNYIISYAFNIPLNHITNQFSNKYFKFTSKIEDEDSFKSALKRFLKEKYLFDVKKVTEKQVIYKLKETVTDNFLSNQMYDYQIGDAQYIQTDYSIQIDNATIKQMSEILTKLTPYTFVYTGNNKKVFDWSIVYNPQEILLQQLKEELDFNIKEKERKVKYYKVVKSD